MDSEHDSVPFPEFVALQEKVRHLRSHLSERLLERDSLVFIECKRIEMEYMLAVGHLEYKAYELQSAVLRYKRQIEMIQSYESDDLDIEKIEGQLDREFEMYQEQLDAQMDKINESVTYREQVPLSSEEKNRLESLYGQILKQLHPDLNPEISVTNRVLFNNAMAAYENRDLERLKILEEMIDNPATDEIKEDSMPVLVREEKRLSERLDALNIEIEKIKTEFPCSYRNFVTDEEALAEKKAELESVIYQLEDALIRYKAILRSLME